MTTRGLQPRVVCGTSHPDPEVEARVEAVREEIGAPPDRAGCGVSLVWVAAYRCAECGRWFHRECLVRHFAAHRDPVTLAGELAKAAAAIAQAQQLASAGE